MEEFVGCVNKSSGTDFFVSVPKEQPVGRVQPRYSTVTDFARLRG